MQFPYTPVTKVPDDYKMEIQLVPKIPGADGGGGLGDFPSQMHLMQNGWKPWGRPVWPSNAPWRISTFLTAALVGGGLGGCIVYRGCIGLSFDLNGP